MGFDRLAKLMYRSSAKQFGFKHEHLNRFKFAVRGRRGQNPSPLKEENDFSGIGTASWIRYSFTRLDHISFVAAYFAFIETGIPQTKDRAVFALHKPSIEYKVNGTVG